VFPFAADLVFFGKKKSSKWLIIIIVAISKAPVMEMGRTKPKSLFY